MPTRTQQGDLIECAYASHGDTKHILLFPSNPAECFELAVKAFDLAERFQTPVFMLSDLDIGMNDWVVPRLTWDDSYRPDRGRVLDVEELERISKFFRYSPPDENFIAARTLPGVNSKGAFFTRGSGHNKLGGYTETPDEYQDVLDRLLQKHKASAKFVPAPVIERREGATIGVVTIGGCDAAVREALDVLEQRGIHAEFHAAPRIPVRRKRRGVPAIARNQLHRRAESRRAVALAADARNRNREREAAQHSGVRRIPAEREARDRTESRVNWRGYSCRQ